MFNVPKVVNFQLLTHSDGPPSLNIINALFATSGTLFINSCFDLVYIYSPFYRLPTLRSVDLIHFVKSLFSLFYCFF